MPKPRKGAAWNKRLASQFISLAEVDGRMAGFMSLTPDGYVDFAYIRREFQGTGLFRRLLTQIEVKAKQKKLRRLTTHASLMARPAFAAMGFQVTEPETVEIGGVSFDRFAMAKWL